MSYAKGTVVSVAKSKAEIEDLLAKHGCSQFGSGWATTPAGDNYAHVTFKHGATNIMLALPMPRADSFQTYKKRGFNYKRSQGDAEKAYRAEERRRWRALGLVIKAKLEAVETGISTLEREFFSDVVLPDGSTLGDRLIPQLEAIQNGRLLLPAHAGQ